VGKKGKGIKKESNLSSREVKIKRENTERDIKKKIKTEIKKEDKDCEDTKMEIKKEDKDCEGWEEMHQEESARPSTPPVPAPAAQTHKRQLSFPSPQQPRPKAPVPPKTPPRRNTPELSTLTSDSDEEENDTENNEDKAPPALNTRTRAAVKGKAEAKKGGLKK